MIACLISYRLLQLLTGQRIIVNEDKIQYNIGIFVLLYSLHFIPSHHRLTVIVINSSVISSVNVFVNSNTASSTLIHQH